MKTFRNLLLAAAIVPLALSAQERFGTRNGHIAFFSETPMENIEANNRKVSSVLDPNTGALQFAVLIKAFEFEKALMQEHFNENYMESNTFPKAEFKGTVVGLSAEQAKKAGTYPVTVQGDLTIHGVTKAVEHKGTITVNADGTLKAVSDFIVKPEDHGIKIPGVVRKNIAEEITVKVRIDYTKL
ncbi:MAG: YceI family protein [Flavobacteriales bacterium]|nr:YceI family protein [Flavobacteriales bacterium]